MPIRFRCAYCNQLLGISRRKAGTVVRCPTCAGQVVVPNVEAEGADAAGNQADPFVFERSDFEELLNPVGEAAQPVEAKGAVVSAADLPSVIVPTAPPAGAWGTHADAAYDVERLPSPAPVVVAEPQPPAVRVTPLRIVIALVVLLAALGLAFGAGLWIGYQLKLKSAPEASARG